MNFSDFLALTKTTDPFARNLLTRIDGWSLPFAFRHADIAERLRAGGASKEECDHVFQLYLEFDGWKDEMRRAEFRDPGLPPEKWSSLK